MAAVSENYIVAFTDEKGKILFVNDNFCEISGYSSEELVGKDHRIINSGFHDKVFFEEMWNTIKVGKTWSGQIKNRTKGGGEYWVNTVIYPHRNAEGKLEGYLALRTEITEQKRLEEEVSSATHIYQNILSSMKEGIVLYNKDGSVQKVNQAACDITNLTMDQLMDLDTAPEGWQLVSQNNEPLDRKDFPSTVALQSGVTSKDVQIGIRIPGVGMRWIQVTSIPIYVCEEEKPEPDFALVVVRDITEELLAQQELKFELELSKTINKLLSIADLSSDLDGKLESVLDTVLDNEVTRIKPQGAIFLMNQAETTLEMVVEKELAKPLLSLCKRVDVGKCHCGKAAELKELIFSSCVDERHEIQFDGMSPHGHYNVPFVDPDGRVLGVMVLYLEHGHQKSSREVDFLNTVGKIVAGIIQKDRAAQKLKAAQHAAKMASIGELAAGVAHEVNNPLAIIGGYLYRLQRMSKKDNLDPKYFDAIERMEDAVHRASKIIKGLRAFGRQETTEVSEFDLSEVISEAIALVREIYEKEGVKVEFDNQLTDHAMVQGNWGKVQEVFMNLLSNAKDASKGQADRQILVRLWTAGGHVYAEIEDNGSGIPEDIREKVFDAFFTTKELHEGPGMGLSVVHATMVEHKGLVEFQSELGKGTTFKVHWPIYQAVAGNSQQVSAVEEEAKAQGNGTSSKKILIVEDEQDLRNIFTEIFEDAELNFDIAVDGEDGFNKAMAGDYGLIISDIKMPKLNGSEMYEKILAQKPNAPKIMFISGGINIEFEHLYEKFKGDLLHIFSKPFDEDEVVKVAQSVLDGSFVPDEKKAAS